MPVFHYLKWAIISTGLGILLAGWLGYASGGAAGALSFVLIASVLAVLEISLSFDNAIVNADKLRHMSPIWRRRFLTWGILIAVFGMRILFPLIVVAAAAWISLWEAFSIALSDPHLYAEIIEESHLAISAFGGAFLMMVGLTYFIDEGKDVDWISALERRLRRMAPVRGLQISLVLIFVLGFAMAQQSLENKAAFLFAALLGLVVFACVEVIGQLLDGKASAIKGAAKAGGLGAFLYLEVLDASFSFDGVIGAFALTQNLLLIAIGLGIGAMYVRSMTILLVERETLAHFKYLEHGAYYSILALSIIMFSQSLIEVPEAITGLLGAGLIGLALIASVRAAKRQEKTPQPPAQAASIGTSPAPKNAAFEAKKTTKKAAAKPPQKTTIKSPQVSTATTPKKTAPKE
ncbi:MAG: DUF475 domain-containing protein [Paracoccaceae bacterium]